MDAYDHVAQATIRSSALPLDTPTASGTATPNPLTNTTESLPNTSNATSSNPSSSTPTSSTNQPTPSTTTSQPSEPGTLSTDLQEAYKSFSTSEWGARLGGFFGSVRKSGESVLSGVRNEASIASEEALKGFGELRREIVGIGNGVRKRGVSLVSGADPDKEKKKEDGTGAAAAEEEDAEGFVARFRAEAERRLKDIQAAEDAADEALLRFGSNIRSFLRDAVTVSAPEKDDGQVLFESKDAEGKRVIHTSRFDAQMHVIHCSLDSFLKDPASAEYASWSKTFSVEKHTDGIASSLQKYEDLRRAMEKLVPERVDYNTFWTRYYFLRLVVENEEKRRKEMLKNATLNPEEEVAWDEDSDSEPGTPQAKASAAVGSETTEARKSGDQHSQPDSDASYDLVSGATSQTPSSPKEEKDIVKKGEKSEKGDAKEDSDEDWE